VDQGKPRAVLLDVGTYHAMMDTLEAIESGGSTDADIKAIRALLKQKPSA
jgi:PHD/YefM family antitoxin component YafN of YafNO toxin-antitoxin module